MLKNTIYQVDSINTKFQKASDKMNRILLFL